MHARSASLSLLASVLALLVSTGAPDVAHAAIYTCPVAGGSTVFQDRPCARPVPLESAGAAHVARTPVGLHASWFERPTEAIGRADCDDAGCTCGAIRRPFDAGPALAVADALYLDGAWHRYANSVEAKRRNAIEGPGRVVHRRLVTEAACDVLISQRILREHAEPVLVALRRRAREAEERGFDDPQLCEGGDPQACEYLDAIELYRRTSADLEALRAPRD